MFIVVINVIFIHLIQVPQVGPLHTYGIYLISNVNLYFDVSSGMLCVSYSQGISQKTILRFAQQGYQRASDDENLARQDNII